MDRDPLEVHRRQMQELAQVHRRLEREEAERERREWKCPKCGRTDEIHRLAVMTEADELFPLGVLDDAFTMELEHDTGDPLEYLGCHVVSRIDEVVRNVR